MSLIFLVGALLSPTTAAMERALDPDELCAAADHVVLAEATSAEVLWGPDGLLYTRTWFTTLWTFKGHSISQFELLLPGGEVDGLTLAVSTAPRFEVERRYVLPLTDSPGGGHHLTWAAGVVGADGLPTQPAALGALGVCHAR